jgi:coenzyme F420-reducing hydrogenase gamma subunit
MFMVWLMEQEDRDDAVGRLRSIIYRDYNNGCLPSPKSIKTVVEHFINHHPERFIEIRQTLVEAIKAYDAPLDK